MHPGSNSISIHRWFSHLTSINIITLQTSFSLRVNTWFPLKRKLTSVPSEVRVLITMKTDALRLLLQETASARSIYLRAPINPRQYITYPENTPKPNSQLWHPDKIRRNLPSYCSTVFLVKSSITGKITSTSNNS